MNKFSSTNLGTSESMDRIVKAERVKRHQTILQMADYLQDHGQNDAVRLLQNLVQKELAEAV